MTGLVPKFDELRLQAQSNVSKKAFDYIDSGTGDEITLKQNRECWNTLKLVPRVLTDITRDPIISCSLFGMYPRARVCEIRRVS